MFSLFFGESPVDQIFKLAEAENPAYIPRITVESYIDDVCEEKAEDVDMLAHIISAECGAEWCDDMMLYYTGSVVLNRIASDLFPDNMHDVIFQEGQYAPTWNGSYYNEPTKRSIKVAKELITFGSDLPDNVIFQANFKQGDGVYAQVQNMYFCYKGEINE